MAYGDNIDQLNKHLSEQLVKTTTGMSINDYTQQTTATDFTIPSVQDQMILDMQQKLQELEMQKQIQDAQVRQELNTPFDETDDFRDYVVWLCGYTQRKTPPSQEEWNDLREETKKVAAKFALRTRTKRALAYGVRDSMEKSAYSTLAGQGVSGSQTLIGNEEMLTGCTSAAMGVPTTKTF